MELLTMTSQHVLALMAGHLTTQISVYLLVKTTLSIQTLKLNVLASISEHLTEQVTVCLSV